MAFCNASHTTQQHMKKSILLLFALISSGVYAQTCVNTDPCNLVCNPHMEDFDSDCSSNGPNCFHYFSNQCTNADGDSGFSNWTTLYGGPYWFDSSCTPPNNFLNYNSIPGDPGGEIAFRHAWNNNTTIPNNTAFKTDVAVNANTRYILSFFRTNLSSFTPTTGYQVGLTDNADITWSGNGYVGDLVTDFTITNEGAYTGTHWEQMVTCFTTDNNDNYNVLYFEGNQSFTGSVIGSKFDNVELVEDHLLDTPQSTNINCDFTAQVGLDLCTVANMQYEWWDVTNSPFSVQLTSGTDVLLNIFPYSISVANSSGSMLELGNFTQDRQLELRRVFPDQGQSNIPINGACNDVVSVSVIAECDPPCPSPETREILFDQGTDCYTYDFSTSFGPNLGETYQWDIDSNGSIDGEGASFTTTYLADGSYGVTLTITNSCGSTVIQTKIGVDCDATVPCPSPEPREVFYNQSSSNCYVHDFYTTMGPIDELVAWDFDNDGIADSGTTTTYPADGIYIVNLMITNSCGTTIVPYELEVDCVTEPCAWPKRYGSSSTTYFNEVATSIVVNNAGEVYVHGVVDSTVSFEDATLIPGNSFLAKYDNCGALLWVNDISAYGDGQTNYGEIKIDNAGNIILLKGFGTTLLEDVEHRLTKFDGNGVVQWSNVIEQWKPLPLPSFDIDQNTNEIYLMASVGKYLRVIDQTGNYIINYDTPSGALSTKDESYIIKFDPSGFEVWQDKLIASNGHAIFSDLVFAESLNRIYLTGHTGNYLSSNCEIVLGSDLSNVLVAVADSRFFTASFSSTGTITSFQLYPDIPTIEYMDLEFSNTDNELYVMTGEPTAPITKVLRLFDASTNLLESLVIDLHSSSLEFNQTENYLLMGGHENGSIPALRKYHRTDMIWDYTINFNSKGIIYDAYPDPISDEIFIGGSYFDTDLVFTSTVSLPLAGGRDAFISRVNDEGTSVSYRKSSLAHVDPLISSENRLSEIKLYPNPTNGEIYISIPSGQADVVLLNVLGATIEEKQWSGEHTNMTFDLSSLASGIYLVKFTDRLGNTEIKKVIKE